MRMLDKRQVLLLHQQLVEETGGEQGVRDEGLLESALYAPFQEYGDAVAYPSLQQKAARLCYGLVKNHPFVDGNKRIGTHVMLVFLALNGVELTYTQRELVDAILQVMDQVKLPAFPLRLEGIGCFCQEKGGDILWAGVRESQGLRQLQSFLERALRLKGFPLEQRGFQPHITLGRKVKLCEGFPLAAFSATIPPVDMEVRKFYLMRSDSPQGILTYTEIYERELEGLPGHSYDSDE